MWQLDSPNWMALSWQHVRINTESAARPAIVDESRALCRGYLASRDTNRVPVYPRLLRSTPKQVVAQHFGVEFDVETQKLARLLQRPETGIQKNTPRLRTVTTRCQSISDRTLDSTRAPGDRVYLNF